MSSHGSSGRSSRPVTRCTADSDPRPQPHHLLRALGKDVKVVRHHRPPAGRRHGAPAKCLVVGGEQLLVKVRFGAARAQELYRAAHQRPAVATRDGCLALAGWSRGLDDVVQ